MNIAKTLKSMRPKLSVAASFLLSVWSLGMFAGDVFSEAAVWHQGFYGSGTMGGSSTTAFPDKLRMGDSSSTYHNLARNGNASGVQFVTDTVVYPNPYPPYTTMVSRQETVAYLPQTVSGSTIAASTISLTNPFAITNSASYTFFVRFKWDGTVRDSNLARFINAGYNYSSKCGFVLGINSGKKFVLYSTSGGNATLDSPTVTANVWTDCAIVVANYTMTIYLQTPGSAVQSGVISTSFGTATATGYRTAIHLGGESGSAKPVFPGYFHAFASWPRALSADEVKEVFAYPMTRDLVRLGTKNGNGLEFNSAPQSVAGSGSATEDWAQVAPKLTSAAPSQTISFTVPSIDAGIAQVLRVAFASDSSDGKVNESVNGTSVGELSAKAGTTDMLKVKGTLLTAGANTVTLTRGESTGDIALDAISLGGGFQIGRENRDKSEFSTPDSSNPCYAYCTNAVWTNVRTDLNYQGNVLYNRQYIHVNVPDEIAGNEQCKLRFKASVYPGGSSLDHTFALYLNGAADAEKTATLSSGGVWRAFECEIPTAKLLPGDNVFCLANISTTGGYVTYAGIDYYRFETEYKKKTGFVILFR